MSGQAARASVTAPIAAAPIAAPADWFQNGFHRFLQPYLKRHFHAFAVERTRNVPRQFAELTQRTGERSPLQDPDLPLLVYSNHASWWDPLTGHFLNRRLFSPRQFYAPIDADALQQYRVFEKLGFFGVDLNSARGAVSFLRVTEELFRRPHTALWMTPEGRFADPRDRHAPWMPGLAHLCARLPAAWVVPMALEYVFWEERLPECLIHFGEFVSLREFPQRDKPAWAGDLQRRLRAAQDALAALVIARRSEPFENLLVGKQGASGLYDVSRRVKSWMTGKTFRAAHGDKFQ